MKKQKAKALALVALGLTGILLAFSAGILAATSRQMAGKDYLTTCFIVGLMGGACLVGVGGALYDRVVQREMDVAEKKEVAA